MKHIFILTLCFVPLINAMDYQERTLQINDRDYKGYYLHENECPIFSRIGMRQDTSFNFLTKTQEIYTEIAVQGRYHQEYYALCRLPSNSIVALYEDLCEIKCFFMPGYSHSAAKAFALCHLYISIHARRSFSIGSSSILNHEESKEE